MGAHKWEEYFPFWLLGEKKQHRIRKVTENAGHFCALRVGISFACSIEVT